MLFAYERPLSAPEAAVQRGLRLCDSGTVLTRHSADHQIIRRRLIERTKQSETSSPSQPRVEVVFIEVPPLSDEEDNCIDAGFALPVTASACSYTGFGQLLPRHLSSLSVALPRLHDCSKSASTNIFLTDGCAAAGSDCVGSFALIRRKSSDDISGELG